MAEHYLRNTVEVSAWCAKCSATTMHRVDGVKKGPCKTCIAKLEAEQVERRKQEPPAEQQGLFNK